MKWLAIMLLFVACSADPTPHYTSCTVVKKDIVIDGSGSHHVLFLRPLDKDTALQFVVSMDQYRTTHVGDSVDYAKKPEN